jgi:hypothetical protein
MTPDSLGRGSLILAVALFALLLMTLFLPIQFNPYPVIVIGVTTIFAVFLLGLGLFASKTR